MSPSQSSSPSSAALGAHGAFHNFAPAFTPRIAQQEMAAAVEDALAHGGTLVVESGTGTGKTYAYLTPVILSGRRTIISTATRHLQEQIFKRDLPAVAKVLGKSVDAVLLKGRANYLCLHRLAMHTQHADLPVDGNGNGNGNGHESDDDGDGQNARGRALRTIETWAAATADGDIAEVVDVGEESPIWKDITSTADNCLGGQCPDFQKCFVVKARQRAMRADIVVVNHHLFFSDLTLKAEGFGELLPQHDAVVFDEAHGLAAIASGFFGFSVSGGQLVDLLGDVADAEKHEKSAVKFNAVIRAVKKSLAAVQASVKKFAKYDKGAKNNINPAAVDFDTLQSSAFDAACGELARALEQFESALDSASAVGENLKRCHERCLSIQSRFDEWLNGRDGNLIRWAEVGTGGRLRLRATPLHVGAKFGEMMARTPAWIFTSATLAVGDDFSAFCNALGLEDAQTRRWESPYNFRQNALLYLPTMPQPRERGYADALAAVIGQVVSASRGRAFCLFTSYDMMNRMHRHLRGRIKWRILMQGDAPKNELLKQFRAQTAVLFGTASFWEGVDVVGESLSCVIIDKLPFAPPDEPVLKNRLAACEEAGNNPFIDIQIPQAVIALKQGAGRLIRSEKDRGVLVLCDSRVVSAGYGKLFLASLPAMSRTRELHDVEAFFD